MRSGVFLITCLVAMASAPANAAPYWVSYDGNDFPENEGWTHTPGEPPAERWIEDGLLVIDSRADLHTTDGNSTPLPDSMDPEEGEIFVARWRLRILEAAPYYDPEVYICSDNQFEIGLIFGADYVFSAHEGDCMAEFSPGDFHTFELRSCDILSYALFIDDSLAFEGESFEGYSSTQVGFGDGVHGGASLTHWDYFEFGVVPEPGTCVLAFVVAAMWRCLR
ncbi:MAG: hypothetical protein JXO22_18095 [Phycisphaerae bacterium]|nr:hypothetical protein [Phycisphaerae bacterium]